MSTRKDKANAIRFLSIDAVQKANSGHPGMPMGMANIAEVLWSDWMRLNPQNPHWWNRDRFVVSNGHGSMLLYSLLHLSGHDVSLEDIMDFRQLHSKTPGHPEYGLTPGVETTTGPLGQGLAMAIGMALGQKNLAAQFNEPSFPLFDHKVYVFVGDGCLMEGISHEVCSLAGTLQLNNLIVFYDDNGISIDGEVQGWFTDDTPKRFESYGWKVIPKVDGHNPKEISFAIEQARNSGQPCLIACQTTIGFGAPTLAGTAKSHGSPLGKEEIQKTREILGWEYPEFEIPSEIYRSWDLREKGQALEDEWNELFAGYQEQFPAKAQELIRRKSKTLPSEWHETLEQSIRTLQKEGKKQATRKSSQQALNVVAPLLGEMLGGSADLTGSNNTDWKKSVTLSAQNYAGNYVYYGVREFGMSAMLNGLSLYGGILPYAGTFLVFSDYARNAMRLSAMMKQSVIYVLTHDSIGLGEDGPTHQPIEHVASLQLIPNLYVWRPCDDVETLVAWKDSLENRQAPSCLALTRQNTEHQERTESQLANVQKGAYVLWDSEQPQILLMASGSEVELVMEVARCLAKENIASRVISFPCRRRFEDQSSEYKEQVLPSMVKKRLAVEAGSPELWWRWVGTEGDVVGLNTFGESAPAEVLFEHFGFSIEALVSRAKKLLD